MCRERGRARVKPVLLADRRCQKSGPSVTLPPSRHLTSTGFPELPGGLNAERIAGVDQRKGGGVDLRSFMHDETGQGLVEYALIIAVIAVAVIVAMLFLQDQLSNVFSNIGNNLT